MPNAKYFAFGTPDENALRFRIVRMFLGSVGFYSQVSPHVILFLLNLIGAFCIELGVL